MKFLVPAFIVLDADTPAAARALADTYLDDEHAGKLSICEASPITAIANKKPDSLAGYTVDATGIEKLRLALAALMQEAVWDEDEGNREDFDAAWKQCLDAMNDTEAK